MFLTACQSITLTKAWVRSVVGGLTKFESAFGGCFLLFSTLINDEFALLLSLLLLVFAFCMH